MSPKSLLRHPQAKSPVRELAEGGFQKVIDDQTIEGAERVRRLILCSGKVYYDLAGAEERAEAEDAAIVRVETLYPFPAEEIRALHDRYPNVGGGDLDPGGTDEHGRAHLHPAAPAGRFPARGPPAACVAPRAGQPGRGESRNHAIAQRRHRGEGAGSPWMKAQEWRGAGLAGFHGLSG